MIRPVTAADAPALSAIYNHYVLHTVVTFEEEPVADAEMAARIEAVAVRSLPYFAHEEAGAVVGYAYAGPWRARSAYRSSVEASVYVRPDAVGRGVGRGLYGSVVDACRERGLHAVIGGIALPNEASVRLHEALGFEKVAHFREVGFKHGRWVDVGYWQLLLHDDPAVPLRDTRSGSARK